MQLIQAKYIYMHNIGEKILAQCAAQRWILVNMPGENAGQKFRGKYGRKNMEKFDGMKG